MASAFTPKAHGWVEPGIYAGVSNPASVYSYYDTSWTLIGAFPEDFAVLCLVQHNGELYAGTMSTTEPSEGIGRVHRYDGGTTWTIVGDDLDDSVQCLVEYNGNLYAGTIAGSGRLYRYDGDATWTMVLDVTTTPLGDIYGFRSAYVWGTTLYLGSWLHQNLGHYDGTTFTHDEAMPHCEGINDYEAFSEYLYAAGGESGTLFNSSDGTTWSTLFGPVGSIVWELETFEGCLYMSLNNGTLQNRDGNSYSNVWRTPDEQGIISMKASFDGNLYLGIGSEAGSWAAGMWDWSLSGTGRVYSYDGTTFELISGDMGTGVQVLYEVEPYPQNVVPEIPLGTIMATATMVIALAVYVTTPRWRRKRIHMSL